MTTIIPAFLKRRRFMLYSPLAPDECQRRLAQEATPLLAFRTRGQTLFRGHVWPGHFELSREVDYSNGFLPVAVGRLIPDERGTHVDVLVGLHEIARGILPCQLLMFVFVAGLAWMIVIQGFIHQQVSGWIIPAMVFSFTVVAEIVAMEMAASWQEAEEERLVTMIRAIVDVHP